MRPRLLPSDGVQGAPLRVVETGPRSFRVLGELDLSSVESLQDQLEAELAGPGDLTLDLRGLTFMDSAGLHLLMRWAAILEGRGGLRLVEPRRSVAKVIETTGLDQIMNLEVVGGEDAGGVRSGTAFPNAPLDLSEDPHVHQAAGN